MRTLEEENTCLKERNSALEAKVSEIEALLQLSTQMLVQYVPDAKPAKSYTAAGSYWRARRRLPTCKLHPDSQKLVNTFRGLESLSKDLASVPVQSRSTQRVRNYGPLKRAAMYSAPLKRQHHDQ